MRRKLFYITLTYMLGLAVSSYFNHFILITILVISILIIFKPKIKFVYVLFIVFLFSNLMMSFKINTFEKDILINYIEETTYNIATVSSIEKKEEGKYSIICSIHNIDNMENSCIAKTLITYKGDIDKPWELLKSNIAFYGKLEIPKENTNPRCFNYNRYLKSKNINTICRISSYKIIDKDREKPFLSRAIINISKIRFLFEKNIPGDKNVKGIIKGILFGDTNSLDEDTYDEFRKNGTAHVLAVSGLHIGILYMLFKKFFGKRPNILATAIFILLLFIYGTISMWSVSVTRAVSMIIIAIVGKLINQRYDLLTGISLVALILLLNNPYRIFDSGFQMSFLAVLSITFIGPFLLRNFKTNQGIAVIISVQLGMIPYIGYNFNYFSFISLLANIPIVYLTSILVPLGMVGIIVFALGFDCSLINLSLGSLGKLLIYVNNFFYNNGKMFIDVPTTTVGLVVAFYLFVFFFTSEYGTIQCIRRNFSKLIMPVVMILVISFGAYFCDRTPFDKAAVVFLDVGQGDAVHIRFDGQKNILIDGGGNVRYNIGERVLKPYFLRNGIPRVDIVAVTHYHTDHYLGISQLIECFRVKKFFEKGKKGDTFSFANGDLIKILWPVSPVPKEVQISSDEENQNMTVYKVIHDGISFLITGDLTEDGEAKILDYYAGSNELKCDVLKVGHHGSKYSTTDSFLEAVSPKVAVIQVGKNYYGHPNKGIVEKIQKKGIMLYRTDENGAIGIITEKGQIKVCINTKKNTALNYSRRT